MVQRQKIASEAMVNLAIKLGFDGQQGSTLTDIQYWLREVEYPVECTFMKRINIYWCYCIGIGMMSDNNNKSIEFPTHDDALEYGISKQLAKMEGLWELAQAVKIIVGRPADGGIQILRGDDGEPIKFNNKQHAFQYLRNVKGVIATDEEMLEKFKFKEI